MLSFVSKKTLLVFVSLNVFSIPAFSASGHPYIATSLAVSDANIGNVTQQIIYSSGVPIMDDYTVSGRQTSSSMFSVNGGYEFASVNAWPAIALGLGLYGNPIDYGFSGLVIETVTGDAPDTLYNYTYNINGTRLMAEVQLTWLMQMLSPFINFGVGPGWIKANSYTEVPVTSTGFVAQPPFQSQTNLNLTYQAGFGITTAFNYANPSANFKQDRIAIGYRYVNLGQTSFATRGATYPYKISPGSLKTNDIYISYTHLF